LPSAGPTWCAARRRPATEEGAMAAVCVFDVNETLLDLTALDARLLA
jgi:hypothetical protein